ncbi:hypothetical protein K439DRAFT_1643153 [Ramaria rubella]|nr:hypothetical protein K439DRAFT_1643153 [Ramaria rubella]
MSNVLQAATLPIVLTHLKYLNMITASSLLIQLLCLSPLSLHVIPRSTSLSTSR